MPPHLHYVEPYFGGGSVLFEKPCEGVSEVVSDLDRHLTIFWLVLRDQYEEFRRLAEATPVSLEEYQRAASVLKGEQEGAGYALARIAWAFFVVARMSMAGRAKGFSPVSRNRTRRGMNEQASAWLSAVEGLPEVHARLKRVVILNRPAVEVIKQQDGENTFFYLDPPYLPETRAAKKVYRHEMTFEQHQELLDSLLLLKGKFILSGYRNPLYDACADVRGWHRVDYDIANHAAGGGSKRRMTECVWTNYDPGASDGVATA